MKLVEGMIIHCKTEEEATELIKEAYNQGFKWCGGSDKYDTHFNVYYDDTVYSLGKFSDNDIVYGSIKNKNNYEVIEYLDLVKDDKDVLLKKDFKKSDLENGMIAETREGTRYLVLNNKLFNSDGDTYMELDGISGYNDNLKDTYCFDNRYDIMRVYKSTANTLNKLFLDGYLTLIWEREEKEVVHFNIGDKVKIISDASDVSIDTNSFVYNYNIITNSSLSENAKNLLLAKFEYGNLPKKKNIYTIEFIGELSSGREYAIISDLFHSYIVTTSILEHYNK